ncbi:hypothetical protein O6H91_22G021100 [Diphasiastrum complanatum]|uniref:Uncharacterized protein n=1 Tax=Diphasiastrum complanatum TaxID=34168 RepID=A0ACC2ADS1_DIPCM|nr:hypothetical protein O6H91_22G021100 [Diphasiastrum complanatum]
MWMTAFQFLLACNFEMKTFLFLHMHITVITSPIKGTQPDATRPCPRIRIVLIRAFDPSGIEQSSM